jgi:hypothetical protein
VEGIEEKGSINYITPGKNKKDETPFLFFELESFK